MTLKKRRNWMPLWLLLAVGVGLGLSAQPWREYREQRVKRDEATAERKRAEGDRADLMRKKDSVESVVGREQLARERGYRKPGEVPIEVAP